MKGVVSDLKSKLTDMISGFDYVRVNNPNIPVKTCFKNSPITPGKFIDTFAKSEGIDQSIATLRAADMFIPNFSVRSTEGVFHKNAVLYNDSGLGKDLLGSCLFLKGTMRSVLPKQTTSVDSYNRSQNFKYDPANEYHHILPRNESFHLIHFSYTSEYFNQFLPENESWAEDLKNRIDKGERILGAEVTPITLAQERALQNIMHCPLAGKLGLVLMETSIVQIILIQLHSLFSKGKETLPQGVNKRDIEAIHELKKFLSDKFLEDHSLHCLSKHFGMNTNKLMVLFKRVFSKSIFEYINELRMEHARQLLYERELLVCEIARTIGYKNPNHFSAAYKKKFGINPSDVK